MVHSSEYIITVHTLYYIPDKSFILRTLLVVYASKLRLDRTCTFCTVHTFLLHSTFIISTYIISTYLIVHKCTKNTENIKTYYRACSFHNNNSNTIDIKQLLH